MWIFWARFSNLMRTRPFMAQVVNRQPFTVEARVQSQASPCGICGEDSGTGASFSSSISILPARSHWCSIRITPMLPNFSNWQGGSIKRTFLPHPCYMASPSGSPLFVHPTILGEYYYKLWRDLLSGFLLPLATLFRYGPSSFLITVSFNTLGLFYKSLWRLDSWEILTVGCDTFRFIETLRFRRNQLPAFAGLKRRKVPWKSLSSTSSLRKRKKLMSRIVTQCSWRRQIRRCLREKI
jgi:hypothetical protein